MGDGAGKQRRRLIIKKSGAKGELFSHVAPPQMGPRFLPRANTGAGRSSAPLKRLNVDDLGASRLVALSTVVMLQSILPTTS